MKCRDFEATCNAWMDGDASVLFLDLASHAVHCTACNRKLVQYRRLHSSVREWGPPPSPSADLVERVLRRFAAAEPAQAPIQLGWAPRASQQPVWWAAAAAAVLVVAALSLRAILGPGTAARPLAPGAPPAVAHAPVRPLSEALSHATEATLDLARETSAPAARIGRQVLATTALAEPSGFEVPVSVSPASDVLQSVGDHVNRGFRPLSGSARHAFGFLIGPALGEKTAGRARERGA